jgi:hypothetical protein
MCLLVARNADRMQSLPLHVYFVLSAMTVAVRSGAFAGT